MPLERACQKDHACQISMLYHLYFRRYELVKSKKFLLQMDIFPERQGTITSRYHTQQRICTVQSIHCNHQQLGISTKPNPPRKGHLPLYNQWNSLKVKGPPRWRRGSRPDSCFCSILGIPSPRVGPLMARRFRMSSDILMPMSG